MLWLHLQVCNALSESARKDKVLETPHSLFSYLIERVRNNLHIVLCMSPVGEPFRYTLICLLRQTVSYNRCFLSCMFPSSTPAFLENTLCSDFPHTQVYGNWRSINHIAAVEDPLCFSSSYSVGCTCTGRPNNTELQAIFISFEFPPS